MVQVCESNRTKNQMLEETIEQYREVFMRARTNFQRVIEVSSLYGVEYRGSTLTYFRPHRVLGCISAVNTPAHRRMAVIMEEAVVVELVVADEVAGEGLPEEVLAEDLVAALEVQGEAGVSRKGQTLRVNLVSFFLSTRRSLS